MTTNSSTSCFPFSISKIESNNTTAKTMEIHSMADLKTTILGDIWSPSVFRKRYRSKKNFIQTNLIALDIDNGCSLEEAKKLFSEYRHIIGTTKSHQIDKNGIICDRFRVVLFLEEKIVTESVFKLTWEKLRAQFTFIDAHCSDPSRQWYPCKSIVSVNPNGRMISTVTLPIQSSTELEANKKEDNSILDSMHIKPFGNDYYRPIYRYLYKKLRLKKINAGQVARFISERVTGLKRGQERINQEWLAKKFKVDQATSSRLIKKLISLKLIEVQQLAVVGFDSTVYRAGVQLREILKTPSQIAVEPRDMWRDGTANEQMLRHIQWAYKNGYSQNKTLKFCLKMQGQRSPEKMRTPDDIKIAIKNWWDKAVKKAGAA